MVISEVSVEALNYWFFAEMFVFFCVSEETLTKVFSVDLSAPFRFSVKVATCWFWGALLAACLFVLEMLTCVFIKKTLVALWYFCVEVPAGEFLDV